MTSSTDTTTTPSTPVATAAAGAANVSAREIAPGRRVQLLNMQVDDISMTDLLDVREGVFATLHVDMIAKLQKDPELYELFKGFDLITCDSQILYVAARVLGTPLKERVSGSDYLPQFYARHADDPSVTIYLCGALGDIAQQAMAKINAKVGRQMVVGAEGPPPGFEKDPAQVQAVLDRIRASKASVLVVGFAAGSQERFIFAHRDELPDVRLFLPLGGTIDYEAGAVKRPPAWITSAGLEWLWRLVREPRRRWRRYLVHQPPVLYHLLRQRLGIYRNPFPS